LINVTAKVSFKEPISLSVPRTPPPTFLFLLIFNCQITDQTIPVEFPQAQSPKAPNPKSAKQSQSGNLEQKTSSPAAPPPSFSEGAYTAIPFSKSTHPNNVFSQFCNILIHNTDFKRSFPQAATGRKPAAADTLSRIGVSRSIGPPNDKRQMQLFPACAANADR
jgi:hypothetical protein